MRCKFRRLDTTPGLGMSLLSEFFALEEEHSEEGADRAADGKHNDLTGMADRPHTQKKKKNPYNYIQGHEWRPKGEWQRARPPPDYSGARRPTRAAIQPPAVNQRRGSTHAQYIGWNRSGTGQEYFPPLTGRGGAREYRHLVLLSGVGDASANQHALRRTIRLEPIGHLLDVPAIPTRMPGTHRDYSPRCGMALSFHRRMTESVPPWS